MAQVLALVASAVCILALAGSVHSNAGDIFSVEGRVYCDPCRFQFETRLSENMAGAKVRLECVDEEKREVRYWVEGVTDSSGQYRLKVEGDHEKEICAVRVVESSRDDCKDPTDDQSARVVCTTNSGIHNEGQARFANPISFMVSQPHSDCKQVLREINFLPPNP